MNEQILYVSHIQYCLQKHSDVGIVAKSLRIGTVHNKFFSNVIVIMMAIL